MKRVVLWSVPCLLVLVCLLPAAAAATDERAPVEIVDQTGHAIRVDRPVEHLVSVYGAGTYYAYTLGVADRLAMAWYIGVKGLSNASEAMFRLEPRLEKILAFGDPNVEEMIAREADLILVDGSRHGAFAEQMNDLGVPTLQFLVETPEALKEAVRLLAGAFGDVERARAEAFADDYDRVTAGITADLAGIADDERARVLFLGTDPLTVASGDMYQARLIEAAGGTLVSGGLSGYWNEVNLEQILLWNPDVILIPPYGPVQPDDLLDSEDWLAIRAVQDGRVHRLPRVIAPIDTPVPESLLGIAWMAEALYPDRVTFDLAAETARFYAAYYGYALSDDELRHLTGR